MPSATVRHVFARYPLGCPCPCHQDVRSKRIYFVRNPTQFNPPPGALIHPSLKAQHKFAKPFSVGQAVCAPIILYLDASSFEHENYVQHDAEDIDSHHIVMSPLTLLRNASPIVKFNENLLGYMKHFTNMPNSQATTQVLEECMFTPFVLNDRQEEIHRMMQILRNRLRGLPPPQWD